MLADVATELVFDRQAVFVAVYGRLGGQPRVPDPELPDADLVELVDQVAPVVALYVSLEQPPPFVVGGELREAGYSPAASP